MYKLLTLSNAKTAKSVKRGYLNFILHLSPVDLAGVGNTCPKATAGCRAACLNTAGRGGMFKPGETTNRVQEARKSRTRLFFKHRDLFMEYLVQDINKAIKRAKKLGLIPVFRLNGTSDIAWEKYEIASTGLNIFETFPNIQFYDYTKIIRRKVSDYKNYHLTFSAADGNQNDVKWALSQNMNVSMVFDQIPATYQGLTVFNGDEDDLRFLDPAGVIVGLVAKGRAKKDNSGFVRRIIPIAA